MLSSSKTGQGFAASAAPSLKMSAGCCPSRPVALTHGKSTPLWACSAPWRMNAAAPLSQRDHSIRCQNCEHTKCPGPSCSHHLGRHLLHLARMRSINHQLPSICSRRVRALLGGRPAGVTERKSPKPVTFLPGNADWVPTHRRSRDEWITWQWPHRKNVCGTSSER